MVGHYESFFTASAGASAAILGLLVVAVSVVNADDTNPTTRELRTVLAGSAFVVLVDIFFVSIVTLTGGSVVFGLSSVAMAAVGLLATRRLIPRAKRAGNFARSSRTRKLNSPSRQLRLWATHCSSASPSRSWRIPRVPRCNVLWSSSLSLFMAAPLAGHGRSPG